MNRDYYENFSNNVLQELKKQGLTQVRLSEISNISPSFVSKLLSHSKGISLYNAIAIAKALNVGLDELCDLNGKNSEK